MTMYETRPEGRDLGQVWQKYREDNPKARIRDAARALGVSELELLLTRKEGVVPLGGAPLDWFGALPALGEVMALTRNQHAVHERVGQVVGEEIDLRLFLDHQRWAFTVSDEGKKGPSRSLQIFDADGTAVHKIYLREHSDGAAFDALVARFARETPSPVRLEARHQTPPPPAPVDIAALRQAWDVMKDTHEFFHLCRRFSVSRRRALELAGPSRAAPVPRLFVDELLQQVARAGLPIMVFVGSPGVLQIHCGPIERVVTVHGWLNVLDPRFNLHLDVGGVDTAWVVRKPTRDGMVSSLELYDAEGETIAIFFGKRKPGQPESPLWRTVLGAS
jgi:putative hemin transport protein